MEVLGRLLLRLAERGLLIKTLLLDRQFFTLDVLEYLQSCQIPFVMPLALRGKKPKRRKSRNGGQGRGSAQRRRGRQRAVKLRDFQKQAAGRYAFTWTVKKRSVSFHVVVAYQSYRHEKRGSRRAKKLLYAVWRVNGTPPRDPRTGPPPLRHRVQLPPTRPGPHPHLHRRPGAAAVLRAGGARAPQSVGLAAFHLLRQTPRRGTPTPPRMPALPSPAERDRPRDHPPAARRLRLRDASACRITASKT